ncbi:efflux RND transporter permease subunit [Acanthopleuribacter pedis]|uniref:Efflux RND transporter permease subunit n=1 Tax=Acanthopleuribacter pedis TaxID=442870 RepID=A0A8J7Q1F3_9BACT|nr:CusA/CzcA family heavy metal efflux RND transporter [Acanthopleuribacter pedis]MBO1317475.1 efflux RND transporter permease subunit [Acanthopleuribacter pedis]
MNTLINFALDNPVIIAALWLCIVVFGLVNVRDLPIDAVPDITGVQVQVITTAEGTAAEDMERFVTFPVETAMAGLPRLQQLRSVTKYGLSVVTLVFEDGTDIYAARQWINQRLGEAREAIPRGYGEPEMGPVSTGLGEIYQFEIRSEAHDPTALREMLDWVVTPALRHVPGVVEVNAFGGFLKTYQVTVQPDRMAALQVTIPELAAILESENRNAGGGTIAHGGEQYLLRGEALYTGARDIAETVIRTDPRTGVTVRVRDVARVETAPYLRQGAVTRDGHGEIVIGIVMMRMGANARTVASAVDTKLGEIQKRLPEGVIVEPFYDRTDLVQRTINTVTRNLVEGGLLVILVLLLFLGNVRAGLIVAAAIPLSMLVAFSAMRLFGISGNLMSLGALDFGLIVDGSVVLIENVVRYLNHHATDPRPHREKVRAACLEIARPVTFGVTMIIIVYLPILAFSGIEGKMFRPMALTVVFALLGSLACALTLMPVLAMWLLSRPKEKEPWVFVLCRRVYGRLLHHTLPHPKRLTALSWLIILATFALIPGLGAAFMPRLDEGAIAMQIFRLPSISLEKSNQISTQVEQTLRAQFPEIRTIISRTGRAEIATDPMGVEISDSYVLLHPRKTWRYPNREALVTAMEEVLHREVPAAIYSFSQPIELRLSEMIAGVRSDVGLKIYGDDLETMVRVADQAAELLASVDGAADVVPETVSGLPQIRVTLDRAALGRHYLSADTVLPTIAAMGGLQVGTVFEGQRRFPLQIRLPEALRDDPASLADLPLFDGRGRNLRLGQVAAIDSVTGPAQISREQGQRRITVEVNVRGRDLAGFVREAKQKLNAELDLPEGWFIGWSGQYENLVQAGRRLMILVPIALLLIAALLIHVFASTRLCLLILTNIPMAVSGGILALWLRDYPFSISAAVGFTALFGIAVLNGVVLVGQFERLRAEGMDGPSAAREGALLRLRPVLMTALVAALGFLPMAISTGAGAEVQRPLATVVIGGLISATTLTLFLLPSLYAWLFPAREHKTQPNPMQRAA